MFTTTVHIPRITSAQVAELEKMFPGFSNVAKVPVVHTEKEAYKIAEFSTNKRLATSEYVSRAREVICTETGWTFVLEIHGD